MPQVERSECESPSKMEIELQKEARKGKIRDGTTRIAFDKPSLKPLAGQNKGCFCLFTQRKCIIFNVTYRKVNFLYYTNDILYILTSHYLPK